MKIRTRLAAVLLALLLCSAPVSAETGEDLAVQQTPSAEESAQITEAEEEAVPDAQAEPPIEDESLIEEEPLTEEEAIVEEEPLVEDEPLTEEEPIVEEEPVVEEEPATEEPLPVEDSLIPIDQMLTALPPEAPLCEVSFPAEVTGAKIPLTFKLNAPGTLVITADSANGWQLKSESGATIDYTLDGLNDAYTESGTDTLTLAYSLPKHVILSGEFTDTINFGYTFTPDDSGAED